MVEEYSPFLADVRSRATSYRSRLYYRPWDREWLKETRIFTATPDFTLPARVEFLEAAQSRHGLGESLGLASLGPVDLSSRYCTVWSHAANAKGGLKRRRHARCLFGTGMGGGVAPDSKFLRGFADAQTSRRAPVLATSRNRLNVLRIPLLLLHASRVCWHCAPARWH